MSQLTPVEQRALSRLRGQGALRANSSADTLTGLQGLRARGLAAWDENRRRWVLTDAALGDAALTRRYLNAQTDDDRERYAREAARRNLALPRG